MATPNLEITRAPGLFDLVAQPGVQIDARETMIEDLGVQNQSMMGTLEKATAVFEKALAERNQAIAEIAAKNEKLQADLIASEARIKELEQLHQAEMKTVKEKCKREKNVLEGKMLSIKGLSEQIKGTVKTKMEALEKQQQAVDVQYASSPWSTNQARQIIAAEVLFCSTILSSSNRIYDQSFLK